MGGQPPHSQGRSDPSPVHAVPVAGKRGGNRRRTLVIAGVLALLAVVVVAGVLWTRGRGAHSEMEQGVALFRTGAYADAASHFFRYARSHPDEVAPHLYLARIHRRLERPDLAAPELKEALRIAPDDAGVHRELGFFFMDAGSYDAAIERFREALRLDPSSETAWVGMVQALRASGQTGMAESMLEQAPAEVQALLGGN